MGGIVTVSCLGTFGRFGNSLFQYAFARAYAELIGAKLLIPENWIGRKLFEGVNEECGAPSPDFEKTETPYGRADLDLYGYFQRPEHIAHLSRAKLKEWFAPRDPWRLPGPPVAIHKRRGDYESAGCYALVSDKSYEAALKTFGYDIEAATIYSDARPAEFMYHDFFQMAASRVLFRANSSFSFWAGVLCDGEVYSPVVNDRTGWIDCGFVYGNYPRLMYMFEDLHIKE